MTNETTRQTTDATNRTMNDVSHTDPHTRRPFGEHVVFARGPTVAADGGEPNATEPGDGAPEAADDDPTERMEDVDHEPPSETEANPVFERGREGRDDDR